MKLSILAVLCIACAFSSTALPCYEKCDACKRVDKAVQRAIVLVQLGNDITDFDKILASVKI